MKKIFIVFITCVLIFVSSNFNSYADVIDDSDSVVYLSDYDYPIDNYFLPAFVFTPQFVALLSSVALACGVVFVDVDDIYDFVHNLSVVLGIDRLKELNDMMSTALTITASGFISWNSAFKAKLVSLFDDYFTSSNKGELFGCVAGVPVYDSTNFLNIGVSFPVTSNDFMVGDLSFMGYSSGYKFIYYGEEMLRAKLEVSKVPDIQYSPKMFLLKYGSNVASMALSYVDPYGNGIERTWAGTMFNRGDVYFDAVGGVVTFPNQDTYDESNIKDGIYLPGDVGDIVGSPGGTVWGEGDNVYAPGQDIVFPGVDNPSIDVGGTTDIPLVDTEVACPDCGLVGDHATDCPSLDGTVDPPSDIFPPWGGGIDFTPVTQSSFSEKFPFSLASDVKGILEMFNVDSKAPIFKVPLVTEEVEIDLSQFTVWASIIRLFILLGFVVCLINLTRKVIG